MQSLCTSLQTYVTATADVSQRSLADPIYEDKLHFMELYVCIQVGSTRDSVLL